MSLFDFSKVETPQDNKYVRPGIWKMVPTDVELQQPETGNPRLIVQFVTTDGAVLKERFILTPKALSRLQYLHEALFGKKLEKSFANLDQLGEYFKKALLGKKVERAYLVGGEIAQDGKVYARLPFSNFVLPVDGDYEEGEFEKDSARYKELVKESTLRGNNAALSTDSAMLPGGDDMPGGSSTASAGDDMPW